MLTKEQLDAIKARVEKATAGPWNAYTMAGEYNVEVLGGKDIFISASNGFGHWIEVSKEDAEFTAHARQDVPALIAEVERLQMLYSDEEELMTYIAEARNELYGSKEYERYFEYCSMITGPEFVVQGMVAEIKKLREALQANATKKDLMFAEEENERLREALRFYAAQGTYEPVYFEDLKGNLKGVRPIVKDSGDTAREALQHE